MAKITLNGQTFETRNDTFGYYNGEPCNIVELRGDYDAWCSDDTVLLHAEPLPGGWVRYWLSSTNETLKENTATLARLYQK